MWSGEPALRQVTPLKQVIRKLTDEQLERVREITPENYTWSRYTGSRKCLSGHIFDLTEEEDLDRLSGEEYVFAQQVSLSSMCWSVDEILEAAEKEYIRRGSSFPERLKRYIPGYR